MPVLAANAKEIARFFDGLDMASPGLVEVQRWRPDTQAKRPVAMWAGVGHKRGHG